MSRSTSKDNPTARERVARMQRAQRAAERRRSSLIWGGAAVLVLAIAGAVTFSSTREQANKPNLDTVKDYTVTQGHVTGPVQYAQTPPAGGEHAPVWLNCGVYDKPVPNENAVHAMEHGAVWVTYRPDLPQKQVDALRQAMPNSYAVLSPYQDLPAPVVASAWGKQLTLTGADDPRLDAFIRAYRQGPQTPEPGAACTGGTDGSAGPGSGSGGMGS